MGLVDLILNLAGLLLWVAWRSVNVARRSAPSGVNLLATLRRADPAPQWHWVYPASIIGLLLVRGGVYWVLGSRINWAPSINLAGVHVFFRSDFLPRMVLYSILSYGVVIGLFYLLLLLLEIVNHRLSDQDATHRFVRAHLGWVASPPRLVLGILPFVAGFILACGIAPLLAKMQIMPAVRTAEHLIQVAFLAGVGAYLPWMLAVAVVLALHMIHNYVYLGNHAFWNYFDATARVLLAPVKWLPLQAGRLDLRPLAGVALVLVLGELGSRALIYCYLRLPW